MIFSQESSLCRDSAAIQGQWNVPFVSWHSYSKFKYKKKQQFLNSSFPSYLTVFLPSLSSFLPPSILPPPLPPPFLPVFLTFFLRWLVFWGVFFWCFLLVLGSHAEILKDDSHLGALQSLLTVSERVLDPSTCKAHTLALGALSSPNWTLFICWYLSFIPQR